MNNIQRYIEFAIENGYDKPDNMTSEYLSTCLFKIQIITSKEFIEAIARGLTKDKKEINISFGTYGGDGCNDAWYSFYEKTNAQNKQVIDTLIFDTTLMQALAIRESKLHEFIENILPNQ